MSKNQKSYTYLLVILAVIILTTIGGAGWYVWQNQKPSQTLSAEQITKKFDCDRITTDFRYTDVFCRNPQYYNSPDSITYDEYYKYHACEERLKNEPPAETARMNDPDYYNAYYDCKDPAKLDVLRLEFIQSLKELRQENSP